MTQDNYTQRIIEAFGRDRSYHNLFPMVAELRFKEDTRRFMEGYVSAMRTYIEDELAGNRRGLLLGVIPAKIKSGEWTVEDAAKNLAADNLDMLGSVYWANTDRKPQRSWDKVLEEVCSSE